MTEASAARRSQYAHVAEVPTRWSDDDVYGHVNNVQYYSFFDTAINAWLVEQGGLDIHAGEVIGLCVESHCEYVAPVSFPQLLHTALRVGHLGRSSVRYELAVFAADSEEPSAVGWFVHVFVDRAGRRPVAEMPARLRGALERLRI